MRLFNLFNSISDVMVKEPSSEEIIQQIHNEFDTAYDREQRQTEELLKELNIPTETEVERKADRLSALGFNKSFVVEQANTLKQKRKESEHTVEMLKSTAELLSNYKKEYPFSSFLTFKELEKICKKYNLTFAPVSAYKMDVPEKNLKEIEDSQKLKEEHMMEDVNYIKITEFFHNVPSHIREFFKNEVLLPNTLTKDQIQDFERGSGDRVLNQVFNLNYSLYIFNKAEIKTISRKGLYICAPKSEFDLTGLTENEFGYLPITTKEIKDPIVFEFCKGGVVRILSKWGLPEYDEKLTSPVNN